MDNQYEIINPLLNKNWDEVNKFYAVDFGKECHNIIEICNNEQELNELMDLIRKHFIALQNRLLFEKRKITKKKSKEFSGLDEENYKRMFELYEIIKSRKNY